MTPLALAIEAQALAKAIVGGEVRIYDEQDVLLCTCRIQKADAQETDIHIGLEPTETVGRGKPHYFHVHASEGGKLWKGTAGVGNEFNLNSPIPELVKGLGIQFKHFVHRVK